ncbi:ATP-binding protein [Streptomyces sp. NPDC101219]|uniref:ATP-binding protein n=1 Tax=Streptomyces sp. NPDC101219 TaxID=3366131 RepID=UPI0037F252A5
MPTLVHRFVLAGEEREVPLARRRVVDQVRSWGVPLNDDVTASVRLVASELISNAVIHGKGPVTVTVYHRPGRLVLDVVDGNPAAPRTSCAQAGDEGGRGLALVEILASRYAWEPVGQGKRVWAEIALPKTAPAVRAAVLRGSLALRPKHGSVTESLDRARPVERYARGPLRLPRLSVRAGPARSGNQRAPRRGCPSDELRTARSSV